ncbi:nucleotidyl transferase AbiEii/AbiGii toxin family protein [Patescibacteria group bacterium]|nr:nucleotidyl transferase AbiEii/AbiGii toxin family protein [Patescibacteria group bacterium]
MLDIQKHKIILVQVLKDIYSDSQLATLLGFKGGTAAYLFYKLPRFSVDLDFNLLDPEKKNFVFEKIKNILKKYGKIKEAREKRFTLFFLLSYKEELRNLKIEISKKIFLNHYKIKNYLGISMLVIEKQDMFAHKLVALLERKQIANRDIFDIWWFAKNNWDINKKIVESRTKKKFKNYLKQCIKAVGRIDNKYILQGLGDIIDERQKIWVKENLKKDTLFLLNFYLENYK